MTEQLHMEKEMATHSSILAWRIPCTEEPGGPQSLRSQGVGVPEEAVEGRIPRIRAFLPFHHKGHFLIRGVGAGAPGPPESTQGQRRELPSWDGVPEGTSVRGREHDGPK